MQTEILSDLTMGRNRKRSVSSSSNPWMLVCDDAFPFQNHTSHGTSFQRTKDRLDRTVHAISGTRGSFPYEPSPPLWRSGRVVPPSRTHRIEDRTCGTQQSRSISTSYAFVCSPFDPWKRKNGSRACLRVSETTRTRKDTSSASLRGSKEVMAREDLPVGDLEGSDLAPLYPDKPGAFVASSRTNMNPVRARSLSSGKMNEEDLILACKSVARSRRAQGSIRPGCGTTR